MVAFGPQTGQQGLERGLTLGFWAQHSLNKFFDQSTSSMRKVDDREKKKKEKKIMSFLVATNVIASPSPERRPTGTLHAHANNRVNGHMNIRIHKMFVLYFIIRNIHQCHQNA